MHTHVFVIGYRSGKHMVVLWWLKVDRYLVLFWWLARVGHGVAELRPEPYLREKESERKRERT